MLWYVILLIVLAAVFALANLVCVVLLICRKCKGYTKIREVEVGNDECVNEEINECDIDDDDDAEDDRTSALKVTTDDSDEVKYVSTVRDDSAENSMSDVEGRVGWLAGGGGGSGRPFQTYGSSSGSTLSAYGDTGTVTGSMMSVASKASWNNAEKFEHLDLVVQSSLIYSKDLRYIAGKVTFVNGLRFGDASGESHPTHVRVHVVVLPVKKYALKTNWYSIPSSGRIKIGEYFKFLFKLPPSELKTMLRMRLYGRKSRIGMLGRPSCMGECYVTLMEIVNARGGLTLSRELSRGIPQAILDGQTE